MFLIEFVESRQLSYKAVDSYIRRNKAFFDSHKELKDGKVWLDSHAVEILSQKYPLAVQYSDPTAKQLSIAQEEIIALQKTLLQLQPKLLLADQTEKELRKMEAEVAEANLKQAATEIQLRNAEEKAKKIKEEYTSTVERLKHELEQEKSKSWLDKLFKR